MNIGKVIKIIAYMLFFINIALIMVTETIIWKITNLSDPTIYLIASGIISIIVALIISILIYGFGDLVDTNNQILKELKKKK